MIIFENEPLAPRTTFRVGGSARFLVEVSDERELPDVFSFAQQRQLNVCIIGGGSNILADDGVAEGVFIAPRFMGTVAHEDAYVVGSGVSWDAFVEEAVRASRWGVENLSGIPGTVGGAIVQNAGAYGSEIADCLMWVDAYDTHVRRVERLTREQCDFAYRMSLFKAVPNRFVIVRAAFNVHANGTPNLAYRDLSEHFKATTNPPLAAIRAAVLSIRSAKFPDLTIEGTAGSFFKNPMVSAAFAQTLARNYPGIPLFSSPDDGMVKVSLAWILDRILSMRGASLGAVRAYEKQPLVIVAQTSATAHDIRAFARIIQNRVREECALEIEPEVCIMHGIAISNTL